MTVRQPKKYLTPADVAALFHVGTKSVTRWASEGKLPHVKTIGGHRRFNPDDIETIRVRLTHKLENKGGN